MRSDPIPHDFQPARFFPVDALWSCVWFKVRSKWLKLTDWHKRELTSEAVNQNPHRAIAQATFTASISMRKMFPNLRKRFFHQGVKTSTKKHFHCEFFPPNKFLSAELAKKEWKEQYCHSYDLCALRHDLWLSFILTPWSGGWETVQT